VSFEPGSSTSRVPSRSVSLFRIRLPPSGLLALSPLPFGSWRSSPLPLVHAFPSPHRRSRGVPSPTSQRVSRPQVRCMFRRKRRGLGRCPFHSPCPLGPQGFALHSVTRFLRPCLISTKRESATLCPFPASGSPYRVKFSTAADSRPQQVRRASLGKTHRLPRYRPASRRAGPPDIRSRSFRPARPPPQRHVAGSLFATYPGSASCFLQTRHL
jgi:hypothetical protein